MNTDVKSTRHAVRHHGSQCSRALGPVRPHAEFIALAVPRFGHVLVCLPREHGSEDLSVNSLLRLRFNLPEMHFASSLASTT